MEPTQNSPESNKYGVTRQDSPYSEAECEEIISKLESLLDGDLDPEREKEVKQLIEECNYCFEQYNVERSIRKLVKSGLSNISVSNRLVSSIRNKIKNMGGNNEQAAE
jgi:anti-sigma factor (TIGR02949 family)